MEARKQNERFLYQHLYQKFNNDIAKVAFKACVKNFDKFEVSLEEKKCFEKIVQQKKIFDNYLDQLNNIK